MSIDRNLLFGALAFQNEYINLAQFAAVCRAWAADKSRPLADVLVERGWIDAQAKLELERLVGRKIDRYGGDARVTLGTVADTLMRDAIRDVEDDDVRLSVTRLPPAAGHVLIETLVKPTENRSRYTLSRLHGQGGLGKVWVARDGDLNREVALKELRPEHGRHPEVARRFLVEAQVTGQLEHPNIVPVYELARRPQDDQPFYTMRFVRGQTLRHSIAEYHRRRKSQTADALELPRLLNAFACVCQAIAYAHSRGVVHRDLKPENVVLGGFGEVIVLDWGLAKIVGHETSPHAETVDAPVAVSDKLASDATEAGRVMGTPAYMAPEQAEGRTDLVDSRTDIYGLGAILYETLTGQPPHEGKDTQTILSRIVAGETPRARAVTPWVPPALDAVCAKAMAKSRSDRYLDAGALARDVQRWLADEPVSCYVEPWSVRAARWVRRHRVATQNAAVLVLVLVVIAGVAAWVNAARQREAAAKRQAERFGEGFRKATDNLLTVVGTGLKDVPGGQRLRLPLLEQAAAAYEEFYESNQNDSQFRMEWGWALTRLGRARVEVGDYDGAESSVRRAESIFAALSDRAGDDAETKYALATSRVDLALILADLGQLDAAEKTLRGAVATYEALARKSPDSPQFRAALAATLVQLGNSLGNRRQLAQAEELLRRAIQEYQTVVDAEPAEPQHRVGLATSYKSLGELLRDAGSSDALAAFESAIRECQTLVNALPDVPEYEERLAASRLDFGGRLFDLGRWTEAVQFYDAAAESFENLVAADSAVIRYHAELAHALNNRGVVLRALGDHVGAESALKRALDEYTSLVKFHPSVPAHHTGLAGCRTSLGQLLRDTGRNREAEQALGAAIAEFRNLPDEWLQMPDIQHGVAVARGNLGWAQFKLGQKQDAANSLRTAIDNSEDLVARHANVAAFADAQAWRLTRLGDVLFDAGETNEARNAYRAALKRREQLAANPANIADHQYKLAWFLTQCWYEELRDPGRAVEFARRAVELAPDNGTYETALAAALVVKQDYAAAAESLEKSINSHSGDPIAGFYLAIARWSLDRRDDARKSFDEAAAAMSRSRPDDPELLRLRAAAGKLLGATP